MKKIPIVGIGASAGGLKEFELFFKNMPSTKEVAFVIIQHLAPNYKSILADIVNRYTEMDVCQIKNNMTVQAGKVYIIPPKKLVLLEKNKLILKQLPEKQGINLPIDIFFKSMKKSIGEKSVAVILSGTGSDGTHGIKEVKEAGGLTIVQQPDTADYDGMPTSAMRTKLIDYVIPVPEMPSVILNYIENEFKEQNTLSINKQSETLLTEIFNIILDQTGNDFKDYKRNTIFRRIDRRLTVKKIDSLEEYIKLLKKDSTEVNILYKEFLISVTSFFRDKDTFDYIEKNIIQEVVSNSENDNLRIWVPACATGEEAYTWAILFKDYIDNNKLNIELQVFASDIDLDAVDKARDGYYANNIVADVPTELLERYFLKESEGYRIKKSIRESVIFAEQNLVQDPPYSRLDLISCRNVLIYFDSNLQQKAISIFHYALKQNGVLVLGNSESLGNFAQYYKVVDKKQKIFNKINNLEISAKVWQMNYAKHNERFLEKKGIGQPLSEMSKDYMLENHTPASIVIDADGSILYSQGNTEKFLGISKGEFSNNIVKTAKDGIKISISNAIRKAKVSNTEVVHKNLRVKVNDNYEYLNISVAPLTEKETKLFIAVFESVKPDLRTKLGPGVENLDNLTIFELEKELAEKEQYLQNTIEELETTNEELKSSNEEAQSTNEELQSTNEELETSKEELQSLNEELTTTNTELSLKVDELNQVNSHLENLMQATEIATIFLDKDLRIFSFTPAVSIIIDLLQSDIGRSFKQFTNNLKYENLINDANEVLKTLIPTEVEVQNNNSNYFWMRINPYRTIDDKIDGIVITFTDITEKKKQEEEIKKSENNLREAQKIAHLGSFEYIAATQTTVWSVEEFHIYGLDPNGPSPKYETMLRECIHPEDADLLHKTFAEAMQNKTVYELEHRIVRPDGSVRWVYDKAHPYLNNQGELERYIGATLDITEKKKAEITITQQKLYLQSIVENTDEIISLRDCENKLVYFNKPFAKAMKEFHNTDTYVGMNTIEILPEKDKEYWQTIFKDLKKGKKYESEYKWDFGNEDIRYYKTLLNPIKSKGKVTGYTELTIDITSHKKQKLELEQHRNHLEELVKEKSEELYTAFEKLSLKDKIMDDALDGYDIIDENGLFAYANKAYLRMWGFENQDEVIGTSPASHCLDPDMPKKIIDKVEKDGWGEFEFKAKRKDNTIFDAYMRVSTYTDENGKKYYHGFSHDVTESNKASKKIQKQQNLLNDAEQLFQIGSWEWDVESDIVYWSDGLFKIFKRSPEEGAPNWANHSSIFVKEDFEKFVPVVEECVKKGTPFEAQLRAIGSDGKIITCISRGRGEKNDYDKVIRLWGVFGDITKIIKTEQDLIGAKERAEESDRLKSAFLANMSHEIRTPMNGILGFTNLLQEQDLTSEDRTKFIEIIQQSGDRMLGTVDDIIEISKIDSGQTKVSTTEVNINNLLKSLHEFFSPETEKKGLNLILDNKLSEDESLILSDENKINSILTNLIKNAIKFTYKGTIKIGCKKNKELLELYIEDSGIGIPADRTEAIFNRFEQADIEDKMARQGSGLGLAISKSYVELLGGEIRVESEENKGSTFFFSIRYSPIKTEVKTKRSVKKQIENKVKKLNILIVEDDKTSALFLSALLNDKAKSIQIVGDGAQAVEIYKNNSDFDLILMDIKLPGIDGLETTKRIRKFDKKVKIIAQTAHALEGDTEKAIKAGCNGYISKPIKKEILFEKIRRCFR